MSLNMLAMSVCEAYSSFYGIKLLKSIRIKRGCYHYPYSIFYFAKCHVKECQVSFLHHLFGTGMRCSQIQGYRDVVKGRGKHPVCKYFTTLALCRYFLMKAKFRTK